MDNVNPQISEVYQTGVVEIFSPAEQQEIITQAYNPSTIKKRQRLLKKFSDWLQLRDYVQSAVPSGMVLDSWLSLGFNKCDQTITHFMTELFEGKSFCLNENDPRSKPVTPGYIETILTVIRWYLKYRNNGESVALPLSQMKMKAIRREGIGRGMGQRRGLTWEQVDNIATLLENDNTLYSLRNALIFRVMSDALLRIGEVPPINLEDFDGNGVIIRSSKTDQEGKGAHQYLCDKTRKGLKQYVEAVGISEGAVFISFMGYGDSPHVSENGEHRRLTPTQIRRIIKAGAKRIGIEDKISGHSLRIGSAVSLASRGATLVDMQLAGRWQSPGMPAHYAQSQLSARGAVARLKDGK